MEKRADIRAVVEADPGVVARRQRNDVSPSTLGGLQPERTGGPAAKQAPHAASPRSARQFEPAMLPVSCLDRYALMGAIAGWWDEIRYELRVIVENGFAELVDGWVETLRSALEEEEADDDEDSDAKKTVKVTLEELLAHPFVRHRMADYVTELSAAQAEVERIKAEKEAWETGDGVEGAEDWLDGAEEGATLPKVLEKRRKDLRAEMGEDDKRRKELAKTTPAGKPSKGSIDWMRAQGMDVRAFVAELADLDAASRRWSRRRRPSTPCSPLMRRSRRS